MARNDGMEIGLEPVGRETVQDRVYSELRRALITGLFAPGQVLTIRQLADALMTSTMPVREALGRLITEQALEALPSRQIRVPVATPIRLDDILRARILIEGEAVALAAARMTPELLGSLRAHLDEWEELRLTTSPETLDREATMNRVFHFSIYRACGSEVLLPMIESLWLQSGPCTRAAITAFSEAGEYDTASFHRALLSALDIADAAAARAALVADISRPFVYLRSKLEKTEQGTP
jgi:DNA-binding GntR family transcriptional regulator